MQAFGCAGWDVNLVAIAKDSRQINELSIRQIRKAAGGRHGIGNAATMRQNMLSAAPRNFASDVDHNRLRSRCGRRCCSWRRRMNCDLYRLGPRKQQQRATQGEKDYQNQEHCKRSAR